MHVVDVLLACTPPLLLLLAMLLAKTVLLALMALDQLPVCAPLVALALSLQLWQQRQMARAHSVGLVPTLLQLQRLRVSSVQLVRTLLALA